MALTYEAIATVTVGSGGAAEIDFQNIDQSYTDLLVKLSVRASNSSTDNQLRIKFNNNAVGNAFSGRFIQSSGSSVTSFSATTGYIVAGMNANTSTASTFTSIDFYIPNYAGSNNKSSSVDSVMENNATFAVAEMNAILWSDTAAITRLTFLCPSANLMEHSTATLYGIKNS